MPRAYDRIVNVLGRINQVRDTIETLNQTLKQVNSFARIIYSLSLLFFYRQLAQVIHLQ